MKYRILEQSGKFYPQKYGWGWGWNGFNEAFGFMVFFDNYKEAHDFINDIELGKRTRHGFPVTSLPDTKIYPYL